MKKSQKERIIGKLKIDGYVTRNQAIKNYITRLSAIIQSLEEDGWEFETAHVKEDNDYSYKVKKSPLKKIIYQIENKTIETYV